MSNADLDKWIKFIGNKLKVDKHGVFGNTPYIKTKSDFTHLINVMVGTSILDKGASLISRFMIEVLKKASSNKSTIQQRIAWFESDTFKDAVNKFKIGEGTQYSPQFDKIFNVNTSNTDWDWRIALTLGIKNPDQCFAGIKEDKKWFEDNQKPHGNLTQKNRTLELNTHGNSLGKKTCYICGFTLHQDGPPYQSTMECEHILPVVSAIQHLWLAAGDTKDIPSTDLHLEYDWAHSCCNGINKDSISNSMLLRCKMELENTFYFSFTCS